MWHLTRHLAECLVPYGGQWDQVNILTLSRKGRKDEDGDDGKFQLELSPLRQRAMCQTEHEGRRREVQGRNLALARSECSMKSKIVEG